jgi:ubiquinone/menaquinone biosynthesis C-methylase UbiE
MAQHYQERLSEITPILLDARYKKPKVDKMLAILRDCGALDNNPRKAVDIGCSAGFFTMALAPHFKEVVGLDIDEQALALATQGCNAPNVRFARGDSMWLDLADDSVDLVLCNHVYEHVPDARQLFREIHRVLRPGGRCYLGAASRLTPIEPHYHLPFLSWLPKPLAHRYMRITGKGREYYENLTTFGGIRKLIADFEVQDYTLAVIADPDRFCARDMLPAGGWLARIPMQVWQACYRILPSYLFILRKRG